VPVSVAPAPVVQAIRVEAPAPQVHVHAHAHQAPRREAPRAAPVPRPEPEKPPLEGSASLRDALAAVTAKRNDAPKPDMPKAEPHAHSTPASGKADAPSAGQHKAPGLKEALDSVAKKTPNPASLPKETLHAMLSVDPELEGSHHERAKHHEPRD
jgi:hypothetical protein